MARIKPSEMSAEWEKYLLELGERIRLFRALKQMTQKDLGSATGTSAPYIYQVETGKQNVSLELMWRIAQGLGLESGVAPEWREYLGGADREIRPTTQGRCG